MLQTKEGLLPKAIIGILTSFFLLNLSWKMVIAGSYAPEIGGFERNVIWGIQQLLAGKALYSNPDAEPFSMIQYMPLYYQVISGLARVAAIQPEDVHSLYQLARGFNLVISLLISGMLASLLYLQLRVSLLLASGIGLLSFLLMPAFTLAARPDTLKAFFIAWHIFVLVFFQKARLRYLFPASLLCSLLCFLCKQDALTSFGLLPFAFLIGKEWRYLFLYSFMAAGLIGISVLLLQLNNDGWFLPNALGALQNGISISWFKSGFYSFFGQYGILFAPALILSFEFSRESNRIFRILSSAFLISFFPQLAASLKFGSGSNYFLEATLISLLLLASAFQTYQEHLFFRKRSSLQFFFLSLVLLWFCVPALDWAGGVFLHQEARLKREYQEEKKRAEEIRRNFPEKKFLLLTDRQWEDNLTTLLWNRVLNPNRDVSEQVFTGKKGNALHKLKAFVSSSDGTALITKTGQVPAFPGLDFGAYKPARVFGNYQVWVK